MSIIYEIIVYGLYNLVDEISNFYPIQFIIVKKELYEIYCQTCNIVVLCHRTEELNSAHKYLNFAIKQAMKNKFIYALCTDTMFGDICMNKVFIPNLICDKCGSDDIYKNDWKVYTQIEKDNDFNNENNECLPTCIRKAIQSSRYLHQIRRL